MFSKEVSDQDLLAKLRQATEAPRAAFQGVPPHCQFLEAAFSERARKKRVAPDGTEEATGKAGSEKREREDIPADRPFAGRSKALASQSERTINNKSRSRDQRNSP